MGDGVAPDLEVSSTLHDSAILFRDGVRGWGSGWIRRSYSGYDSIKSLVRTMELCSRLLLYGRKTRFPWTTLQPIALVPSGGSSPPPSPDATLINAKYRGQSRSPAIWRHCSRMCCACCDAC